MEFDVMQPYRLIFLDVDGTLVGADDIVPPRTLASLEAVRRLGCAIVLCTARNHFTTKHIAAQWRGNGCAIFSAVTAARFLAMKQSSQTGKLAEC